MVEAAAPPRRSMIRSSMIFSGLTLVSRFMGAARDLVISAKLGASLTPAADAYATALAFPNLFRRIFAEGFTGSRRPVSPDMARHRPMGLAVTPDGALLIADSVRGTIWRVTAD